MEVKQQQPQADHKLEQRVKKYFSDSSRPNILFCRSYAQARIRRLLAKDNLLKLSLDEFNQNVWHLGTFTLRDRRAYSLLDSWNAALTGLSLTELQAAVQNGDVTLSGNQTWGSATYVYGPMLGLSHLELEALLRKTVYDLLYGPGTVAARIHRTISQANGFGINSTTGILHAMYPDEHILYNLVSIEGLKKLGIEWPKNWQTSSLYLKYLEWCQAFRLRFDFESLGDVDLFLYSLVTGFQGYASMMKEVMELGSTEETDLSEANPPEPVAEPPLTTPLESPPQEYPAETTPVEQVVPDEPAAPAPAAPPPPIPPFAYRSPKPRAPESRRNDMQTKALFSKHFLDHRISEQPEWQADPLPIFAQLRLLWQKARQYGERWNEAQTEDEFIKPILKILGWSYTVQTKAVRGGQVTRPDYALFADEKSQKDAYEHQGNDEAFYSRALAIAEAKYWGRPLSQKDASQRATWKAESNPSHQMVSYLVGTRCPWGILTNGLTWRLYSREVSSTASEYYEVDLGLIFDFLPEDRQPSQLQLEQFKRWWLFFRQAAFTRQEGAVPFVQRVHEGSATYARQISDKLKELVFEEVMPEIASGFVAYRRQQLGILDETPESLKLIYQASLSLLYKLLFILYAEARALLPMDNAAYHQNSLTALAEWAAEQADGRRRISEVTHATPRYESLLALFHRIDQGDPSLGIPRYNGGLFSPKSEENQFLETHKLSDQAVARAVDILVRDQGQPVDYAYISVRNLGAIYEGLLENKLTLTSSALDSPPPAGEGSGVRAGVRVTLINDKGERKATGSYYTPDYIVEYIVRNTLDPLLEQRQADYEAAMGRITKIHQELKRVSDPARIRVLQNELGEAERQGREAFLGIKVLDPAMGSGHFLVNAVDHLTDGIIQRLQTYHDQHPEARWGWDPIQQLIDRVRNEIKDELASQGLQVDDRRLDDTALLTRLVMKRCIYGVDLNRMAVELAKVSLWLHSFTVGAPLSFLDHHLRWGNSLIGTDVRSVEKTMHAQEQKDGALQFNLFGGPFAGLLDLTAMMIEVAERADATLADVRDSAKSFEMLQKELLPYKQALNLWVSQYFGNKRALEFFATYRNNLLDIIRDPSKADVLYTDAITKAQLLWQEKRFFHWDLEFPEVFVDLRKRNWAENSGFDAVIGNPPYVDVASNSFYQKNYHCQSSRNLYSYILERSMIILSPKGRLGKIVPLSLVCADRMEVVREWLKEMSSDVTVANFGIRPSKIFPNVDQRVTIILSSKKFQTEQFARISSTRFHHWRPGDELKMIRSLSYIDISTVNQKLGWAKLGNEKGRGIINKLYAQPTTIKDYLGNSWTCYYHGIGRYWLKAYDFIPTYIKGHGKPGRSSTLFDLSYTSEIIGKIIVGLINSSLFFWYWVLFGDDFHLTRTLIESFPFHYMDSGLNQVYAEIERNVDLLMQEYREKSVLKRGKYPAGMITWQEFYPRQSKHIIDKIDDLLGILYGLTPDEIEYIKNYDIEFRTDEEEIAIVEGHSP